MTGVDVYSKNDYCIISTFIEDANDLVIKVQELTNEGWIVSGGIASSSSKLFQAMIRRSK
tara:strand:+ start:612 stop:791 length:180 start_codon:yes stop_codon:yes gene_type:complete